MITDRAVTYRLVTIIGNIPYFGLSASGAHSLPNMKFENPTFEISGIPLVNRNTVIVISAPTEKTAERKKIPFISFSLAFMNL